MTRAAGLACVAMLLATPAGWAGAKRVDVGGFKLNLVCTGKGSPVVVLDSGAGDTSATWDWVTPGIKEFTKVCAYDRAGLGKSAPGPLPRSSDRIAEELHNLLSRAGVRPPYVLVGHSFGGMNVRVYAARYPEEAAGLVLVDATPEAFIEREPALVTRLEREKRSTLLANAPPAFRDELAAMPASVAAVRAAGALPGLPVAVLTAGLRDQPEDFRTVWFELQDEMAAAYPGATRFAAATSGHYIPFDQPDVVVDAIREVVEAARARR